MALIMSNRAFKSCCGWMEDTTQKRSRYLRVLVERKLVSAQCSPRSQYWPPHSAAGSLSYVGFCPWECLPNGHQPEPHQLASGGMRNQPHGAHGLPLNPACKTTSRPYLDTPSHWSARSVPDPFHAPYHAPQWSQDKLFRPTSGPNYPLVPQQTGSYTPSNAFKAPNRTHAWQKPRYAQYGNFPECSKPPTGDAVGVANPITKGQEKENEFLTTAQHWADLPPAQ
jgi:hypothetical protein